MKEMNAFESKVYNTYATAFASIADAIRPNAIAIEVQKKITTSLLSEFGPTSEDIAFHLSDWAFDGAFLTLLHLRPEIFSEEEVKFGLEQFLIHAPNHIAAAAKLSGNAIQDIFNVNALDGIHQLD